MEPISASGGIGVETPRWLRQPRWLFVGGSVGAAILAVLAECCGSVIGYALLAADVLIIVLWISVGRPTLEIAVPSVAAITIAFGWFGGTPEPALFQPIVLAAGVGWWMPGRARSLACLGLLAIVPLVGGLGPAADWGWWNWSIGTLFAWTLGRIIRQLDRALAELTEARSRLVATAAMDERRRIARDVHDLVGHSLTAMLLNVRAARQALDTDPREAGRALDDAARIGKAGLADVRSSMLSLREPSGDEGGATASGLAAVPDGESIRELLGRQTDVRVSLDGPIATLRGPVAVATYRLLQECLTNIARHAVPGSATLALRVDDERVALRAENGIADAARRDVGAHRTLGLVGMRERVASLGGRIEARRVGDRWQVDGEIPRR